MTWTYNADPTVQLDRVRILVGDTDEDDQLISDEEIGAYLTGGYWAASSDYAAAASVADNIAAKMARRADSISAYGTSVTWAGLAKRYQTIAAQLRRKGGGGSIYAGGISRTDKDVQTDNTDNITPAFTRDSYPYENPLTGEERQYRGA